MHRWQPQVQRSRHTRVLLMILNWWGEVQSLPRCAQSPSHPWELQRTSKLQHNWLQDNNFETNKGGLNYSTHLSRGAHSCRRLTRQELCQWCSTKLSKPHCSDPRTLPLIQLRILWGHWLFLCCLCLNNKYHCFGLMCEWRKFTQWASVWQV
jgi:hypothetical protein